MHDAKLIAITKPVGLDFDSPSDLLAYCARVSSTANQHKHETGPRLLAYLVRHKEWSPFQMANIVVEVSTTRDIGRQILRHTSLAFQEFSQRYAAVTAPPVFREARMQDEKNRQNSLPCTDRNLVKWWQHIQEETAALVRMRYEQALERGLAKEVARAILQEGLTPSTMYINGSVRSWIHYTALRTQWHTQKEHRDVARSIRDILVGQFPAFREALPELYMDEEDSELKVKE
jgi:thymidylate synthase (FAD)